MVPINIRLYLGIQTVIFVALGFYIWTFLGHDSNTFASISWREIGLGFSLGMALIAAMAAFSSLFPTLSEKIVRLQTNQFIALGYPLSPFTIVFISTCAGIGEEALFRAGIQTLAIDYLPTWIAVILTSIPFTLIHASKPLVGAIQFMLGCILGSYFFYTGSLLAVMIGHAVYDIYALWSTQHEIQRLDLIDPTAEDQSS